MSASTLFMPSQPPRVPDFVPAWRGMFGERLRSVVHGTAEPIYDLFHKRRSLLGIEMHVVSDPAMIGHVLLDNHANYQRPPLTRQLLRPVLGNGLLTAEGDDWRKQRRLVAPTFSPAAITGMMGLMGEEAARQSATFPQGAATIDMARLATDTTMAIISNALFSGDARLLSDEAGKHVERLVLAAGQPRFLRLMGLERFDWSPHMMRVRQSRRFLRGTLAAIVDERGPSGGADDFFGGLMRSFYASMEPDEARSLAIDNAVTFYAAGHETTAVALAWGVYLAAAQPALQEDLRDEAHAALVSGGMAGLPERLPLLHRFLDEVLRLYPPAAQIIRQAMADDELPGSDGARVPVKAGELIFTYPWVVHRHRKLWDQPDAFDIDRFSEGRKAQYQRFQYLPFGAGPRICPGARFATVEALIILAHWLASRRFRVPEGFAPIPTGTVTLRPKGGMRLIVEPV